MIKDVLIKVLKRVSDHTPKKKNIWVFGAWSGMLYADNSKYLFEYVNRIDKSVRCIWISKNPAVVEHIRNLGNEAYRRSSLKGVYYCLRAGAAFITAHPLDLSMIIGGNTKIFQLWHGMGMKAVGLDGGWYKNDNVCSEEEFRQATREHAKWIWLCASEEAKEKYHKAYFVPYDRFIITGEPKGDTFTNIPRSEYIEKLRSDHPGVRIAVYLPTHRNFGNDSTISGMMSMETLMKVNSMLETINAILIFKPHFHEFAKYENYEGAFSNIIFATDKATFGDVYEFLPACDMLITDYSGIMFGYLASGKPIIYFPYDKESYVTGDAGFCYDYNDILYGPECMTWEEVVEQIRTITAEQYDADREKQRLRFCPYSDGKSCERVYQEVRRIVN